MVQNESGIKTFWFGFGGNWARFAPLAMVQLLMWEFFRKQIGFGTI
jgi:hypothetical protein